MRNFPGPALALPSAALIVFLRAAPARAHAFGARYDLPLPLELYLAGAASAVALSFVIMALASGLRTPTGYGSTCSVSGRCVSCFTLR